MVSNMTKEKTNLIGYIRVSTLPQTKGHELDYKKKQLSDTARLMISISKRYTKTKESPPTK